MNSLEKTEDKVNFIVTMFKHYQVDLTIPEQIGLLTVWEESCVLNEEYEMANALKKEMEKIQKKPSEVPQKNILQFNFDDVVEDPFIIIDRKEEYIKKTKPVFYIRFFRWVKSLFNKKN